mgnify:FL=1
MKYKNIVFDFGNVIGKFDGHYILRQFCSSEQDLELLFDVIFSGWGELDKGTVDYNENIENVVRRVPARLEDTVRSFFRGWPEHIIPIRQTADFIRELKDRKVPIYLLSNAPTYFAEWAQRIDTLRLFDGIVFSAPLKMAKPEPEIYQYLFRTYDLKPEECFFIDDLEKNIRAAKEAGMDGIIFTGSIDEVKEKIEF